ncbi:MAG TPA: S1-like domain-containing RNA-binding protein [Tissierellaceae bacterium]
MIELGKVQELKVNKITLAGAYLVDESKEEGDVLLPRKELPQGIKVGDKIKVMVYDDPKGRRVATTKMPKAQVGEIAYLKVVNQTKFGYFLDWGLDKDLFLPFSETIGHVERGKSYLVGIYVDKSDRICATMKIKDMLRTDSPYKKGDKVKGTIYNINRDIGAFVAVDNKYEGLIAKKDLLGVYEVGDVIEARVSNVKEDGKLDLSLREVKHVQMDIDKEIILEKLKENGGFLPFNDDTPAEIIRDELNMSKSGFKRAIGRLYKEGKIDIDSLGIKLK